MTMMQSSKELIDRGFAYLSRAVVVEQAVKALQHPDRHDPSTVTWAQWVLESLPENKKEEAMP